MSRHRYTWKHTSRTAILHEDASIPDFAGRLYETEDEAFEAFRDYVGQAHVCESLQDNFELVKVYVTDKHPQDFSDCVNCAWGKMRRDTGHWFECDECGNRTYHN